MSIETTLVKICGITDLEDASFAVESAADMLGFNFYQGSKRYIEPAAAAKIVHDLGGVPVVKVGVFVNADVKEIAEIAERVRLDAIQLHGDEDAVFAGAVRSETDLDVIKVIRIHRRFDLNKFMPTGANAILIDSYSPRWRGGTGKTVDWAIAKEIEALAGCPIILAGGLSPDNVARAIRQVRPYGVDVASGVEASPGKKDPRKVAAFIKAAKEAT